MGKLIENIWNRYIRNTLDELIIETIKDKSEYSKNLLEECMISAGQTVLKVCPVECEGAIMENLSQKG